MLRLTIEDFSPAAIAESGQCFRMRPVHTEEQCWELMAGRRYLRIWQLGDQEFQFSCSEEEWADFFRHYFDLDVDYSAYRAYCLEEDEFLKRCMSYGQGIRILHQDPYEALISFLISQRKSVPAIRTIVERMSEIAGEPIENAYGSFHAFPSAEALAACSIDELRPTGAGYRIGYILDAARQCASGELDLDGIGTLPDEELISVLMKLRGCGIKVASCTALFGFHRLGICPQDVWMNRVLHEKYQDIWPQQYQPVLGVLQQYMFHYARLEMRKTTNNRRIS